MKKAARGAATPDPAATAAKGAKRGKPEHTPTKKSKRRVRMLAGLGFTQEEMALLLDISETTLKAKYEPELRIGGLEADEAVMTNLFRMATGKGPEAGRMSIFYAKVRRQWHEVQRVLHGYDPETIKAFVRSVVLMLRRELPKECPGCKTQLDLGPKVAAQLVQLSKEMSAKLPQAQFVPVPGAGILGAPQEP